MNRSPDRIYFVVADDVGMVKIGSTSNPRRRLSALQGGSPVALRLACTVPGDKDIEAQLHSAFRDDWAHSEWFRLSPRLLSAISRIAAGEPLEAVVRLPELSARPRPHGRNRFTAKVATYRPESAAA
jgi:hypothetical protein